MDNIYKQVGRGEKNVWNMTSEEIREYQKSSERHWLFWLAVLHVVFWTTALSVSF